jgi:hypothetical protein
MREHVPEGICKIRMVASHPVTRVEVGEQVEGA